MSSAQTNQQEGTRKGGALHSMKDMYREYFLDYASYVIMERAIPSIVDGLKPVHRRILHSMRRMDDGRYHKVANIIGHTMQFHPHGDASIGDALVHMGQKDLLIDTQGNWGDVRTGDGAAAPRYIEARLSKFALEVAFNPQTTEWQLSYDGRKKEPIDLPMKFPLLLAQGADGIAVGLATKILPHNFQELIKASIQWLKGRKQKIYPDFMTGGSIDVSDYQGGKRGGKVILRATIKEVDKSTLLITDIPYGITTSGLVDSILKAHDSGKIKIKKVTDNTAKEVEIRIDLPPKISPTLTIDALYAFTHCQISISPNACVIDGDKPVFLTVDELLRRSTDQTKALLGQELEIKKAELLEKIFFSSLEKIFIEKRIYRQIEECETWEAVLNTISTALEDYVATPSTKKASDTRLLLPRDITEEDIVKLTEIKIKRISKFNSFKADELLQKLNEELKGVSHDLAHLTEYAISYFEDLMKKYGKGRERRTVLSTFDDIDRKDVVITNSKLWVNYKEGFVGYGLKKSNGAEFVKDCSDMDDVIAFTKDGKFKVVRIAEKSFIGKNILYADVWKKGDERSCYSMIYLDGQSGKSYAKRFQIKSITRDKLYDLTKGSPRSKVHYFKAHPNGEAEVVTITLRPTSRARNKVFKFSFEDFGIKGRTAAGNIITKYPILKVTLDGIGSSSAGAYPLWIDEVSGKLNKKEQGRLLGEFDTGDTVLAVYYDGTFGHYQLDLNRRFEMDKIIYFEKFDPQKVFNLIYYDANKTWTMLKRFRLEVGQLDHLYSLLGEDKARKMLWFSDDSDMELSYKEKHKSKIYQKRIRPSDFVGVKGWKAAGNKLSDVKISSIKAIDHPETKVDKSGPVLEKNSSKNVEVGESIEFEITNHRDLFGEDGS